MELRKIWIFARGWGVVVRDGAVPGCVTWFLGIMETSCIVLSILLKQEGTTAKKYSL